MQGFLRNKEQCMDLRHGPVDPPTRPHFAPMEDEFLGNGAESGHFADFGFNRNYETKPRHATDIPLFSEELSGQASIVENRAMTQIKMTPEVFFKTGWLTQNS